MSTGAVKSGVKVYGARPEMVLCHTIIQSIFQAESVPCVITSIKRNRSDRSLHNVGYAHDYRTKHIVGANRRQVIDRLVHDIKAALPCCDVVFEYEDEPNEHIHVEFDPKDDERFQQHKAIYQHQGVWPTQR